MRALFLAPIVVLAIANPADMLFAGLFLATAVWLFAWAFGPRGQ